jgi:hypothetical protein
LQTQGTAVPAPTNAATQYAIVLSPWVIEGTAAVAKQLTNAEQAQRALEEASTPPGVTPSPEEGDGGGAGGVGEGCSGMNACAASAHGGLVGYHEMGNGYLGCSIWASWGSQGLVGSITIYGHFECTGGFPQYEYVPHFELQIALFMNGAMVGSATKSFYDISQYQEENFNHSWACPLEQATYRAWVFGRQYGVHGKAQWWAWGYEAATRTECRDPLGNAGPPPVPIPPKDG